MTVTILTMDIDIVKNIQTTPLKTFQKPPVGGDFNCDSSQDLMHCNLNNSDSDIKVGLVK